MIHRQLTSIAVILFTIASFTSNDGLVAAPPKGQVWTSPNAADLPLDYHLQGEFAGNIGGKKLGVQVIALGDGAFQAVIYRGGLPGAGWDEKGKSLLAGTLNSKNDRGEVVYVVAEGNRRYLAQKPEEFSATKAFPPKGDTWDFDTVTSNRKKFTMLDSSGKTVELKQVHRTSPTMGKQPPMGATVLFDGSNADAWQGGRLDQETKLLNTDGKDIRSKKKFNNYHIHIEFMLPFRPFARGQGRGNSGFYQVDHFEVQILDSFGLEGVDNECGGVYKTASPSVNMCLPPLQWQTYDVDFKNAVTSDDGKILEPARLTLYHNGVKIHDNIALNKPTGGHRSEPVGTPGPLKLQGHGNPLQYRNIWIIEK